MFLGKSIDYILKIYNYINLIWIKESTGKWEEIILSFRPPLTYKTGATWHILHQWHQAPLQTRIQLHKIVNITYFLGSSKLVIWIQTYFNSRDLPKLMWNRALFREISSSQETQNTAKAPTVLIWSLANTSTEIGVSKI